MDNKLSALEKKLKFEEDNLHVQSIFQIDNKENQSLALKKEINELMEYKTKGAMIRCRADWVELGEKPTSYFLSKEKQRKNDITLDMLIIIGNRVTHQLQILKYELQFYKVFYTSGRNELLAINDISIMQ